MENLKEKIEGYLEGFEVIDRKGEDIVVFSEKAGKDLKDAVYSAHGDRMPNDWIFDKFHSILSNLLEYNIENLDDMDEYRAEIVDGLVDVYTSDLTAWLNESNYNVYYMDEAVREYGEGTGNVLMMAQYMAIDEIFGEVYNLLTE